jgi:hypothetical protein
VTVSNATLTVPAAVSGTMSVETVTVNVTYQHSWLLLRPVLALLSKNWGTTITLSASSQMRIES